MKSKVLFKITILLILISASIFLVACGTPKDVGITTKVSENDIIVTELQNDKSETANYQGYIDIMTSMDEKYEKNLKKVTVKDIKFSKNDIGLPIMYRYNKPFNVQAVQAIYSGAKNGNIYTTYEYLPEQFSTYGFQNTAKSVYTTKIQYLIMQVNPTTKREKLKREVQFTMIYEFSTGDKIEKPVKVEILK